MNHENTDPTGINNDRQKLIDSSQFHSVHWLILALSSFLTVGAWYIASEQVNKKITERFERESLHVIELVKERMQLYEHALWGAVAYIDASDDEISNQQWSNYANSLRIDKTYPSINGLGGIYAVNKEQRSSFVEKHRKNRPDFTVHPGHQSDGLWPITFVEPLLSNKQAVGLDVAFEESRYLGVKKARDSGLAQLTAPIIYWKTLKKPPVFFFMRLFTKKA